MKLNIKAKILGGFLTIIALLVAVSVISWNGLNTLGSTVDVIVHEALPEDNAVRNLEFEIAVQGEIYFEYALTLEDEVLVEARAHTKIIEEVFFDLEQALAGEPELLAKVDQIDEEYGEFLIELELVAADFAAGDTEGGIAAIHLAIAQEAVMEEELADVAHEIELGIEASFLDAKAAQSSAINLIIAIAIISVIVALVLGVYLSFSISGAVRKIADAATDMAEKVLPSLASVLQAMSRGDLTQRAEFQVERVDIKSKDEIGEMAIAFNSMADRVDETGNSVNELAENFMELIGQVRTTAGNLGDASNQLASAAQQAGQATQGISTTTQQLASGAQQQSESVDSTTSAIGQLSKAIEQIAQGSQEQAGQVEQASSIVSQVSKAVNDVAQSAQAAASGSQEATEAAQTGSDMVAKTVEGMQKIEVAVTLASDKITELGTQSAEIGKIVAVIDDIAAQTNLLALNAAIEAARAGEQGRGFAVVADEVRKLAERVTDATKEIANLIDTVQKGVDESIKATEDGAREVAEGAVQAQEAGKILEQILSSVSSVSGQIEQISAAAEEVSASSDEMVKTIDNVSSVVEQNSAAAEQMTANSDEVSRSIESVAGITQESSAAAQEMSASAEQMSAQVEEVVASAEALSNMSRSLQQAVSVFNVGDETGKMTNGSSPTSNPKDVEYPKAPEGSPPLDKDMAMSH